jgi:hypothetical protein
MKKERILEEIRRTAKANGGVPLGVERFFRETGIRQSDWFGKYWSRWGDALREAGYEPNTLQGAYGEDFLIESYIGLIRELGRFPSDGEVRLKRRKNPAFPSHNSFRRFGAKRELVSKIREFCRAHSGFDEVEALLPSPPAVSPAEDVERDTVDLGYVYLLKAGRYYKVGKTNAAGRRERELAVQLPEKAQTVHVIRTDDSAGIEAYWHGRFAGKRKHGEWFELDARDVKAFRRRKFM